MSPVAGDIPKRAHSNVKSWREVKNAIDVLNQRISELIPGGGGGLTAPADLAYLLENASDGADVTLLANRRILAAGANINLTDGGAGSTLTIAATGVATNAFLNWTPDSGGNIVADSPTDTATLAGGTGISTVGTPGTDTITINLDDTAVTPASYGSATAVGTFTVDQQGRLTAAADATISIPSSAVTDFAEAVDDRVATMLTPGEGIDLTYDDGANTLTVSAELATTSNKGVASFATADFNVTGGAVELKDTVLRAITTDSGALTIATHGISILGGSGIDVTHAATVITVANTSPNVDQNLFATINCPAGTNPVADTTTDTLNLTSANAHLTITGNSTTDTVDFAVITGTSGTKIALLDGVNTWSAVQLFSGTTELQFRDSGQKISSSAPDVLAIDSGVTITFRIGGTSKMRVLATGLIVTDRCQATVMTLTGDSGGVFAATTFTNATAAPSFGGPSFPNMFFGGNAAGVGWAKFYIGTTASFFPYWQFS